MRKFGAEVEEVRIIWESGRLGRKPRRYTATEFASITCQVKEDE